MPLPDFLLKAMSSANIGLFRLSNGRIGGTFPGGVKVLLLTVTGRKTGKPRTTPLLYIEDGDKLVIVASKGGAPEHPLWYRNLVANPEVTVEQAGGVTRKMRAITGTDEEHASYWPRLVAAYAGYADYQKKTERKIPIVLLTDRPS